MPTIARFEDIEARQETGTFTRLVCRHCFSRDWAEGSRLGAQIGQFGGFPGVSRNSTANVASPLRAAMNLGHASDEPFQSVDKCAPGIARKICALMEEYLERRLESTPSIRGVTP